MTIEEITGAFVKINERETARPNSAAVAQYRDLQSLQDNMSLALRPAFVTHRALLSRESASSGNGKRRSVR